MGPFTLVSRVFILKFIARDRGVGRAELWGGGGPSSLKLPLAPIVKNWVFFQMGVSREGGVFR